MRWVFAILPLSLGCVAAPRAALPPSSPSGPPPDALAEAALDLARRLPPSERCSVAMPARIAAPARALVAQVSQSDALPWTLPLDVWAYARAERIRADGARQVVAYLRLARPEPDLARLLTATRAGALHWGEGDDERPAVCADVRSCAVARATLVDATTVRITEGEPLPVAPAPATSGCVALLAREPRALEVSARAGVLPGSPLRETRVRLRLRDDGVERAMARHYASADAAARALRELSRGDDELGAFGGLPVTVFPRHEGAVLAHSAFVPLEVLALAAGDAERLARTELRERPTLSTVDPADTDAVRTLIDHALSRPLAPDPATEVAYLQALDTVVMEARVRAPGDDALALRHFRLRLRLARAGGDARGPWSIADEALRHGLGDPTVWRARRREALAGFDEAGLALALSRDGVLPAAFRVRGARELVARLRAGADYERAEWALAQAHALMAAAHARPSEAHALVLSLTALPRIVALLAQADGGGELVLSALVPGAHPCPDLEGLSIVHGETRGAGVPARVFAARTAEPVQLVALGRALAACTRDGPLTLQLGLERSGQRAVLSVSGRRRGFELAVARLSRPLGGLRWALVDRLVSLPLHGLGGALYPPDELTVAAASAAEALAVREAAEREPRIRCAAEGLTVRCRGSLGDRDAADRALRAVARALLAADGRALWSRSHP